MKYFDLKVGFTCNNNCIHCVVSDKRGTKDLTTKEVKSIIDTVPIDTAVGFTGGEATIRKDFIELLSYARETGHKTILQTNGAQFSDWDFAVDASKLLDHVLIAIHSHIPVIHDAIVRVSGMYDKTIEGFKNIIKLKISCGTQTVISKLNIENLLKTYDFIQEIKPGIEMNLTYPHPNGNALTNADIVVLRYSEIKDIILSIVKKYGKLLYTEAIPMCYLYPYQDDVNNLDEYIRDSIKPGLDPANKNNQFFDNEGRTQNYALSMLNDKRKGIKCLECLFNDRCVGVWKEYAQIYKNNFDLFPIIKNENIDQENKIPANDNWGALIIYGKEKCMNTCTFCSGSSPYEDDDVKFEKAIKEIDFHFNNGIRRIEISGGDPGEYSRIVEVVDYISRKGAKEIQLSTHGRTLKDLNFVKDLKLAGITQVRIPLYGSMAEIHNKTAQYGTSSGNAFDDCVEGIINAVECEIPISGYILLNQYNKLDINNIIQLYLDLAPNLLNSIIIGITFIARLDYKYTGDWFLPIKDMGPYLKDVLENHPKLPQNTYFKIIDVPYCVFGDYVDIVENPFEQYPNLGLHDVEESNRSSKSPKIPHYRIKEYFHECEQCCLKNKCGAIPVNELKMFGTYGLKAIKE